MTEKHLHSHLNCKGFRNSFPPCEKQNIITRLVKKLKGMKKNVNNCLTKQSEINKVVM